MATRNKTDIERALLRKGFQLQKKKDHRYYAFQFTENIIIETKVSHGTKRNDIASHLISKMAKQCHLSKNDFLNFIDCSLSQEQYQNKLHKQYSTK
jgi:predicted RNA binding protein YcfA (HicA-like mRNA interferase family)